MTVSFAPLEGITGWIYRSIHHTMFPGVDAYYTPFVAPTTDSPLSGRGLNDVLPEHNPGVPLVPQLLTNRADDFIAAARTLADLGYTEVNLNLGCPSGTVVSKKKGSGFLGLPEQLEPFLDQVFSQTPVRVSIKTRIGLDDPEEWPDLLALFDRYPIATLIVHPRIRQDFYKAPVRREAFSYAVGHTVLPLCYNGDLNSPADCQAFSDAFPSVSRIMLGRGLVANPALVRQLHGGPALTKAELRAFHDAILDAYRETLFGDHPVLGKMKELWFYWSHLFPQPAKYLKAMRKARSLAVYLSAVDGLFRDQDLSPNGHFQNNGPR